MYDILILGAGPAGISAALTGAARGRSVLLLSNDPLASPLAKAPRIDNYPGLSGLTGAEVLTAMLAGTQDNPLITRAVGRVTALMPLGNSFMASAGSDVYEARALILASGAAVGPGYPGETSLLGRGVSYCATCDGMLYRGKSVAVIDPNGTNGSDADFLRGIGCTVEYFTRSRAARFEILGSNRVNGLRADDVEYPVDGVFILRSSVAASVLLPGLASENGHIQVDTDMRTNLPGVFAAGDCTGRPYQLARAVGQGNMAALSADTYIKSLA